MKKQIKMIVFVIILGLATSSILTGMDYITADRIEKNDELKLMTTIVEAFELEYTDSNIEEVFTDNLEAFEKDGVTFYRSSNGEVGFEFDGSGLWGPIKGFITLNEDLETIKAIQIIEQEETPGLGGVVAEKQYLDNFKSKKMVPELLISKNDGQQNSDNEVDAITGATLTSKAFEGILNEEFKIHKEILVK